MYKIIVHGIVQGVGFRPYIYRKAIEQGLIGSVKNTGDGVEILINERNFIQKLTDLPPLARISDYTVTAFKSKKRFSDFSILQSTFSEGETELPPDIYLCADCLRELKDRKNRRYNYYFITCTNCGPRFTMIEDYPYDRPSTSMQQFEMCPDCRREYTNPLDRRYHAQTIACKNCGPKLHLICDTKDISGSSDIDTIKKAVTLIKSDEIISVKGIGGFHTCSLCNDNNVLKIRRLFNRPHKPYAIMVKDVQMAKRIAYVSTIEKDFLESPQRPIVVLRKKNVNAFNITSELDTIGVMLPYTALHYLLFDYIKEPLVMTSSNMPGEPISTTEKIGRYFLTHERRIVNRCDDSVVKIIHTTPYYLRRSRGFAPLPVLLPIHCKDTIAVGAQLNNVICATKKNKSYLSQYMGDTSCYETYNYLKDTVERFIRLSRVKPQIVACDLHPHYNSTILAFEIARKYNAKLIPIQHHQAHVASVAAEHHFTDYIGIAMDGLGYGENGQLWGGEVFSVHKGCSFTRIGHLEEQPQLGGDSAAIHPMKMLFGILSKTVSEKELMKLQLFKKKESQIYLNLLRNHRYVPLTTSTGRILDAASALLGLCKERTYDGRPALILESTATTPLEFDPVFSQKRGRKILMTTPLFDFLLQDRHDAGRLAATTQMYLAKGLFQIAKTASKRKNLPIVFSGGVAYNRMISGYMLSQGALAHKELPAGDGCICYGQTYIANLSDSQLL